MIKKHLTPPPYLRLTIRWYSQCFRPIYCLHILLSPIFIDKLQSILQNHHQHPKNMTPNTDAPDAADDYYYDVPNAAYNYSAYTK